MDYDQNSETAEAPSMIDENTSAMDPMSLG